MALVIEDRVMEKSVSNGTGDFTLTGAETGYRTFSTVCSVGDSVYYTIQSVASSGLPGTEWECGYGTYSAANTLTRTTIIASSNSNAAVSFSAGNKQVFIGPQATQAKWAREKLFADRTYYVATTGSDSNTGLSAGSAFLTLQKAMDTIASIDLNGTNVTISVANGTYTAGLKVKPLLGGNTVTVTGNTSTPSSVVISAGANNCFDNQVSGVTLVISGFKTTNTSGGNGLYAWYGGVILFSSYEAGGGGSYGMSAGSGGIITAMGNYTISGGSNAHWNATRGGCINVNSRTVTITGTPTFLSYFAYAQQGGIISCLSNTFSGGIRGVGFYVTQAGLIASGTSSTTYLPGSAGTVVSASYGYYGA